MVFAIRQVQEKSIEQNMYLYDVFINLTKAFDRLDQSRRFSKDGSKIFTLFLLEGGGEGGGAFDARANFE